MTDQPTPQNQPPSGPQGEPASGSQSEPQHPGTYSTPPPPVPAPYKRLTRTTWDAPVSGVCGGIARYLGVDPTLIRVLAVIAMVFTFPLGPIVYLILWGVIPKDG